MAFAIRCLIGLAAATAPQDPAPAGLPGVQRLGVAWVRAGELDQEVQGHLLSPHLENPLGLSVTSSDGGFARRLVVLGRWDDEARAAAESQGIERVLVLERARCSAGKPVTKEYGDRKGRTARLRFIGAEWEVRGGLCARELGWAEEQPFLEQGESQTPWALSSENLGEKVESEADPELELARAVRRAYRATLADAGARLLWGRREAWLAPESQDPSAAPPWAWYDLAERKPLPLASLATRCRADLVAWRQRWEAAGATVSPAGQCGWCAGTLDVLSACACPDAEAFERLLGGARSLIQSGHGSERAALLEGLTGPDPRATFARLEAIYSALVELPEAFRARLLAPQSRFRGPGLVRVLLYADQLPRELAEAFDPDLASAIDDLAIYGGESLEPQLGMWNVKLQMPTAALVRLHERSTRGNAKVLARINLRTADAGDLEDLFQQALRANLDGDD